MENLIGKMLEIDKKGKHMILCGVRKVPIAVFFTNVEFYLSPQQIILLQIPRGILCSNSFFLAVLIPWWSNGGSTVFLGQVTLVVPNPTVGRNRCTNCVFFLINELLTFLTLYFIFLEKC